MEWIISINGTSLDCESAFKNQKYLYWVQNHDFKIGDTVYIYIPQPIQQILYKTEVVGVDIDMNQFHDQKRYWRNESQFRSFSKKPCMKLYWISSEYNGLLSINNLKANGLPSGVSSCHRLNDNRKLREYLKESFPSKQSKGMSDFENQVSFSNNPQKKQVNSSHNTYSSSKATSEMFISKQHFNQILNLLERKKSLILQGASGVGKSFIAREIALNKLGELNEKQIRTFFFNEASKYNDLTLTPLHEEKEDFRKLKMIFDFCDQASKDPEKKFLLILENINNISADGIYTEFLGMVGYEERNLNHYISGLDSIHSIPNNLYIIGTMKNLSESSKFINPSLHRRFGLYYIEPAFETPVFEDHLKSNGVNQNLRKKVITNMIYLNSKIENEVNLGKDYRVGHSYFCNLKLDEELYQEVIKYEIAPLLSVYWHNDHEIIKKIISELT